ncbi:MAG TPA: AsmA-like C-terminal region-containing protein, partial [Candidatus Competibacter sp.]|nr:AsmA-like C-terminal region-containing protein [Candidatus Competibacter sp.]
LDGALKFRVGPGQLRDINPGLGRMIGMLSVQNLTRRLSFDFSDLFQPGMGFDRISGDFTFKRGQAYTDNMLIEAPAARIEIQGRTGLRTRDYDQTITVIPQFGGTLPVAGAIAGGPVVGAAVFVAERLLQKDIERATRYRYSLKGSWDDPVMEYLQDSSTPTRAKGFASDN